MGRRSAGEDLADRCRGGNGHRIVIAALKKCATALKHCRTVPGLSGLFLVGEEQVQVTAARSIECVRVRTHGIGRSNLKG